MSNYLPRGTQVVLERVVELKDGSVWNRGDALLIIEEETKREWPTFRHVPSGREELLTLTLNKGYREAPPNIMLEDEDEEKWDTSMDARVYNMRDMQEYARERVLEAINKILQEV